MTNQVDNKVSKATCGDPTLLERCLFGEVLLIPQLLQQCGVLDPIYQAVLTTIAQNFNDDIAQKVSKAGFDKLHEVLEPADFITLTKAVDKALGRRLGFIYKRILKRGFPDSGPLWVLNHPISRIVIPFDKASSVREQYNQFSRKRQGRVTTLRPHRDSWYAEPNTCVNLWLSLGATVHGNGISIFLDEHRRSLNYISSCGITRDQAITTPTNLTMRAGDALLFYANHLHGSELNCTDITRFSLSLRIAFSDPKSSSHSPERYCLIDPKKPLSFLQLHSSKRINRFFRKVCGSLTGPDTNTHVDKLVHDRNWQEDSATLQDHYTGQIAIEELTVGVPMAISRTQIVVKIFENGTEQVWKLERGCPHEGADLALGNVDGRTLRCPWHNLPIDITTGSSACSSLRSLKVGQCEVRNGIVHLDD